MKVKQVFIIDDDEISIFLTHELLKIQALGRQIHSYLFAEQALSDILKAVETDREKLPDVIFLDLNMPLMSGWNFLDSLRLYEDKIENKCIVYILTSAIDTSEFRRSSEYKLVAGYFNKPLEIEVIDLIKNDLQAR